MKKLILFIFFLSTTTLFFSCANEKDDLSEMIGSWRDSKMKSAGVISKEAGNFFFTDINKIRYPLSIDAQNKSLNLQVPLVSLRMNYASNLDALVVTDINSGKSDTAYRKK